MNNFVGLPSIPLIGKYGRKGYEFNEVKSLLVIETLYDAETQILSCIDDNYNLNLP